VKKHSKFSAGIGYEYVKSIENRLKKEDKTIDSNGYELRHFLNLLKRGNTQCLEMLHNNIWLRKTPEMDLIQYHKQFLIDSNTVYKTLKGYSYSERKLIFGTAHQGQIGDKRKKAVEKYGYSYRNASHAMRLIRAGILFFRTSNYPINIVKEDKEYGPTIFSIKTEPQFHKPELINEKLIKLEEQLNEAYQNRLSNFIFDDTIANRICYDLYMPILKSL
jgi:predicted nucleotidyltransferase